MTKIDLSDAPIPHLRYYSEKNNSDESYSEHCNQHDIRKQTTVDQ